MRVMAAICAVASAMTAWADAIVIAHRGASGYLPEHTLEAYAAAHAMGADYIEPDLVLTKDNVFICLHDIYLEPTTNVEELFPDRKRADGRWYAADFSLAEVKRLSVHERLNNRFPQGNPRFDVPTFVEMVELVQGMNKTTGRIAGIYPELKEPTWHRDNGLPMEESFVQIMAQFGYSGKDAKAFVQCFEAEPLRRMREELKSELPMIQLIDSAKESQDMLGDAGLAAIAKYADGIGPAKSLVAKDPDLVKRAHEHGLAVHPFTFRADNVPASARSFEDEIKQARDAWGVDGVFTDHPDRAVKALR